MDSRSGGCRALIDKSFEHGRYEEAGSSDPGPGFENPLLLNKCVNFSCFLYKPATALDIAITGADSVTLSWATDATFSGYDVYRSTEPYAGFTLWATDVTGGSYEDGMALGDPAANSFYTVQSSCGPGGGSVTPAGDTAGEFDFALTLGS